MMNDDNAPYDKREPAMKKDKPVVLLCTDEQGKVTEKKAVWRSLLKVVTRR